MDQIVNGLRDILQYVIGLAGLVAVGFILYGGFKYMSSRDDPRAVAGARTTLINATVGLILSVMAFPLTNWVIDRVAPGAQQVSDTVLDPVVVERIEFGLKDEINKAGTDGPTRTVLVKFSAPVCVEGQGSNLKLRTDRGNMNLLTGTGGITAVGNGQCEASVANQKEKIPFQIADVPQGGLATLTVFALVKNGSVNIVSPSGAPVNETISATECKWSGHKIKAAGTTGTSGRVGDPCEVPPSS